MAVKGLNKVNRPQKHERLSSKQRDNLLNLYMAMLIVKKHADNLVCLCICFVALHPKSTAMVMAGPSVQLTTLFPGQA